ncbi:MAG: bifunctional diguanylate cyclase/phosphodiesterase [Candidatus Nanopelagicales bacterium]
MAQPAALMTAPAPGVGPESPAPRRRWITALFLLADVLFIGYALWLLGGDGDYLPARDLWLYCALLTIPVLAFLGRAALPGPMRGGWLSFGAGASIWVLADGAYVLTIGDSSAATPVWINWLYILAPVLFYLGVVLLARVMLPRATLDVWLDGLIIAFATLAAATLMVPSLLENVQGDPLETFFDLSGPLTSLLLASLVLAVLSLTWTTAGPMWWLLLAGALSLWLTDVAWLLEIAGSGYVNGSMIDLGWPGGMLLLGAAAWTRMSYGRPLPRHGWALPLAVTLLAFAIVLHSTQNPAPTLSVVFAAVTVLLGAVRSVQAFRSASARAEAQRQAVSDELTGLANRRALTRTLEADPTQRRALLLVDIDRFKQINDTLGHQAGDEVLQQVSARFQAVLPDDALIGRLGGDEFAVLLAPGSGWDAATAAAESLHASLAAACVASDVDLQVEISIGIAFAPQNGTSLSELLSSADRAMKRAKRDRVGSMVFDQRWDGGETGGLLMMQELRKAIDHGEFTCHYQPQLDVLTDEVVAMESLVRWHHPQRGLIPAGQFMPLLEQTAMVRPLADLVLEQSLEQLRVWDQAGLDLRVCVNLSATNLMDRRLPLRVADLLARHQIPAERLTLEITETALTSDHDRVRVVLGQLHEIGAQLSIDDYGSGYSSLQQIGRLTANELKLDREFVTGVGQRGDLQSILSATVHLAHGLRLRMVAEGVESGSDLDQVRAAGCDLAQGYFISAARSAEDITAWLWERSREREVQQHEHRAQ